MLAEAAAGRRGRGGAFWVAAVAAALLLVGGVTLAVASSGAALGPDDVVRAYYAALERADAPAALGYGAVPAGPHALLSSAVLAEQQRIAPISAVDVAPRGRTGSRARVGVAYTLAFADGARRVHDTVHLRLRGGQWRLTRVAVRTQLFLSAARQRASILGARIPRGYVLLFPGAVPIRFDTPYLQPAASSGSVDFASLPTTQVGVAVSALGRHAAVAAASRAVRICLTASAGPGCPQPPGRVVPGTLRGDISGGLAGQVHVAVGASPAGVLHITGRARVNVTYHALTFRNRVMADRGQLLLPLAARTYAVRPLRLVWGSG